MFATSSSTAFLRLPGITGVGLGPKIVKGRAISKPAVVVFVDRKKPMAELEPSRQIPPEIGGIPTDVEVLRGRPKRASGPWDAPGFWVDQAEPLVLQMEDLRPYRDPFLLAGCQIVSERDPGNGTLGFFVLTNEDPAATRLGHLPPCSLWGDRCDHRWDARRTADTERRQRMLSIMDRLCPGLAASTKPMTLPSSSWSQRRDGCKACWSSA